MQEIINDIWRFIVSSWPWVIIFGFGMLVGSLLFNRDASKIKFAIELIWLILLVLFIMFIDCSRYV